MQRDTCHYTQTSILRKCLVARMSHCANVSLRKYPNTQLSCNQKILCCFFLTSSVFVRVVYSRLRDPADCNYLLLHEYNHDLDSRRAQDFEEHQRQSPSTFEESVSAGPESYENCANFRIGLNFYPFFSKKGMKFGT